MGNQCFAGFLFHSMHKFMRKSFLYAQQPKLFYYTSNIVYRKKASHKKISLCNKNFFQKSWKNFYKVTRELEKFLIELIDAEFVFLPTKITCWEASSRKNSHLSCMHAVSWTNFFSLDPKLICQMLRAKIGVGHKFLPFHNIPMYESWSCLSRGHSNDMNSSLQFHTTSPPKNENCCCNKNQKTAAKIAREDKIIKKWRKKVGSDTLERIMKST